MRAQAATEHAADLNNWMLAPDDRKRRERLREDKIHDFITRRSALARKEAEFDEAVTKTNARLVASAPAPRKIKAATKAKAAAPAPDATPSPAVAPPAPTRTKSENDRPNAEPDRPPRKRARTEPELPSTTLPPDEPFPRPKLAALRDPPRASVKKPAAKRKSVPKPALTDEQKAQARKAAKEKAISQCNPELRQKNRLALTDKMTMPEYIEYIEKFGLIAGDSKPTKTFAGLVFYFVCQLRERGALYDFDRGKIDYVSC